MSHSTRVLLVFGTRPEAIKLAPLDRALRARPEEFDVSVCATAQHREMLDQVLDIFGIVPDVDLDLMRPGQGLADLTAAVVQGVEEVVCDLEPDLVVVQGDTTTTMAAALAAFYRDVRVAHVEAGLRTHHRRAPFPEEINRRITSVLADWHFAPTERACRRLLEEGVESARVFVTGNTVVDALRIIRDELSGCDLPPLPGVTLEEDQRLILATTHRRESFGGGLERICRAIRRIAGRGDVRIVLPVHPNPEVQRCVRACLGEEPGVTLTEPLGYREIVDLLARSHLVLTDSGGLQEEAPALGKPVVVLRETTERPEVVEAGGAVLVGTDTERIVSEVGGLLDDPQRYRQMARARNPYGDGDAAEKIASILATVRARAGCGRRQAPVC